MMCWSAQFGGLVLGEYRGRFAGQRSQHQRNHVFQPLVFCLLFQEVAAKDHAQGRAVRQIEEAQRRDRNVRSWTGSTATRKSPLSTPRLTTVRIRTVVNRGVESGDFRVAVDPVQLYISIAALCFFYLSNIATLSVILAATS